MDKETKKIYTELITLYKKAGNTATFNDVFADIIKGLSNLKEDELSKWVEALNQFKNEYNFDYMDYIDDDTTLKLLPYIESDRNLYQKLYSNILNNPNLYDIEKQIKLQDLDKQFSEYAPEVIGEKDIVAGNIRDMYALINQNQLDEIEYENAVKSFQDNLVRTQTQLDYMNIRLQDYLKKTSNIQGGITSGDKINMATQFANLGFQANQEYQSLYDQARAQRKNTQDQASEMYKALYDDNWKKLYESAGLGLDTISYTNKDIKGQLNSAYLQEIQAVKGRTKQLSGITDIIGDMSDKDIVDAIMNWQNKK